METMETREELQSQELQKILDEGFQAVLDEISFYRYEAHANPIKGFIEDWSDLDADAIRKRLLLVAFNLYKCSFEMKYKDEILLIDMDLPYFQIGFKDKSVYWRKWRKGWKTIYEGDLDWGYLGDDIAETNARLEKLLQEGIKGDEVSN